MKELIIEIPYGGLGDHLFHSHLPRIAKESGQYRNVYISSFSEFRHHENKELIWELNPFIDGFIDKHGNTCDLKQIVKYHPPNHENILNILDAIMLKFDLDDGKRLHEPEIYFKPTFIEEYNKRIFDPNFLSFVGNVSKEDMMWHIKNNHIEFDAIMKLRNEKALYIPKPNENYFNTPTLKDFCNLIYSSRMFYCLTSGPATLASALAKNAIVFYGEAQWAGFRHSQLHKYILIQKSPKNRFLELIKTPFRILKKSVLKTGQF